MFDIIKTGGWLMLPIFVCSIAAMGIIIERFWTLQRHKILPPGLLGQVWAVYQNQKFDHNQLVRLKMSSPLGFMFAVGIANQSHGRQIMQTSIEEAGRRVVHRMERFLNLLGTIAAISPLLGLLGTVSGMIRVFSVTSTRGLGDPTVLAGGISEALLATAAGLAVAIPSYFFHRYFERLIDDYVLEMEDEALKLIDILNGDREDI